MKEDVIDFTPALAAKRFEEYRLRMNDARAVYTLLTVHKIPPDIVRQAVDSLSGPNRADYVLTQATERARKKGYDV